MNRNTIFRIKYDIKDNQKYLRIFGRDFVINNLKYTKFIFENKIYDLVDIFKIPRKEMTNLKISLIIYNNIQWIRYV